MGAGRPKEIDYGPFKNAVEIVAIYIKICVKYMDSKGSLFKEGTALNL